MQSLKGYAKKAPSCKKCRLAIAMINRDSECSTSATVCVPAEKREQTIEIYCHREAKQLSNYVIAEVALAMIAFVALFTPPAFNMHLCKGYSTDWPY